MKVWKLSLAGLLSVCLISSFANAERVAKAKKGREARSINAVAGEVLANSKMWRELEEVSSHVKIRIRWRIPYRREVLREMRAITYRKHHLRIILKRGKRYIPLIKQVFKRYRIPDELVFLPVIESSFRIKAISPAGAAGLWQFMPATAREYGLRVDRLVDERYDVEKSTIAAARYLRDLYRYFRNWGVVLASYNMGKYAILKRIRGRGTYNFWAVKSHIPRPARKYTIRFFATIQILKAMLRRERFKHSDMDFEIVKVRRGISLRRVARLTGIPLRKLRQLNPHLKRGIVPHSRRRVYNIYVPRGYKHSLMMALNLKDLNNKLSKLDDFERDFNKRVQKLNIDYELKNLNFEKTSFKSGTSQTFSYFNSATAF